MAVRKAPQAAASWVILRAMPRSSGAPPPDLRVRASACMPLGSKTSSRPGTFLQSSASARLVSSLPRRRRSNSSGRSSGGSLSSRGSSTIPSEVPASVPPSSGMGSDMVTPSTNMNVIWCFHAPLILSRHFPAPAVTSLVCGSRIDSRYGGCEGERERQDPGLLARGIPHPGGRTHVGRATRPLLRDRLRPRACQGRRGGLAPRERHRPPQFRRGGSPRADPRRVTRRLREAGNPLGAGLSHGAGFKPVPTGKLRYQASGSLNLHCLTPGCCSCSALGHHRIRCCSGCYRPDYCCLSH